MCGIAGIWERSGRPADRLALQRMADMLAHRGPDGSGFYVEADVGLANRRLRILDLSEAADQPMRLPDGSLWLTFNGEIHNYVELRQELESRGLRFRTRTDTEVVLWAYATWGRACFERFNGMWGLALWDVRERRLVLSRDRFGIKPIYYSVRGDRVCFASEPKAILAGFPEEREPDREEIERFLAGGYPDAGEATFFRNIRCVPPATCVVVSREGFTNTTYWRFVPGDEAPQPDAEEQFRGLLTDAVKLRTRSHVPIGMSLSGGLDSSSIASVLDRQEGEPMPCFSTVYDESAFDESRYAALVAREHGMDMHWVRPEPSEMLETMRKIVWHHDAPTSMRGRFAQWFVLREAALHVKVLIGGQGGDELLTGYPHDPVFYLLDRLRRPGRGAGWWRALARETSALADVEGSTRWFLLTAVRRYLNDPRAHGPRPYDSMLNNVLWNGLRSQGLPDLLHGDDALAMAFSIEPRTPFLDHRLVELCFSLPFDEKIAHGWTKSLLRRSMAGIVPPAILARRRKFGHGAPLASWLRHEQNWRATRELLLDPGSLERGILDARWLERSLAAFQVGPSVYTSHQVGRLIRWITLEFWFRDFIDANGSG